MRSAKVLLEDIAASIHQIQEYVEGKDRDEFLQDRRTQAATLWELIAIGEAARRLPEEIRQRYPELPWKDMMATRDFLAHGYYRVDATLVWQIVERDLPALQEQLDRIQRDLER